jgi:hypothetical protein
MTIAIAANQRLTPAELPQATTWRMKDLLQASLGGTLLQRRTIDRPLTTFADRQYYMDAMSKTLWLGFPHGWH